MSQENMEVVKSFGAAMQRRDVASAMSVLAPDAGVA
jgi:limonene-1,2-epoxide hydrolase